MDAEYYGANIKRTFFSYCIDITFRPWMFITSSLFFIASVLAIGALFSPAWATLNTHNNRIGLIWSCSESFGCYSNDLMWCLPDRDNCQAIQKQVQLSFLFCLIGIILSSCGCITSMPFLEKYIIVMGPGLAMMSSLSLAIAVALFATVDRHFFQFSKLDSGASYTYGFYICAGAIIMNLLAGAIAIIAAHSRYKRNKSKQTNK